MVLVKLRAVSPPDWFASSFLHPLPLCVWGYENELLVVHRLLKVLRQKCKEREMQPQSHSCLCHQEAGCFSNCAQNMHVCQTLTFMKMSTNYLLISLLNLLNLIQKLYNLYIHYFADFISRVTSVAE